MSKPSPTCTTCNKPFSRSAALTRHMLIHNKVKKFSCKLCGRSFTQPGDLTRHVETHEKNYQHGCVDCGKRFQRPFDLKRHRGAAKGLSICPKSTKGEQLDEDALAEEVVDAVISSESITELAGDLYTHGLDQDEFTLWYSGSSLATDPSMIDPNPFQPQPNATEFVSCSGQPESEITQQTLPLRFQPWRSDAFSGVSGSYDNASVLRQTTAAYQSEPTSFEDELLDDWPMFDATDAGLLDMVSFTEAASNPHSLILNEAGSSASGWASFSNNTYHDYDKSPRSSFTKARRRAIPGTRIVRQPYDLMLAGPQFSVLDLSHPAHIGARALATVLRKKCNRPRDSRASSSSKTRRDLCEKRKPLCSRCLFGGRIRECCASNASEAALDEEIAPMSAESLIFNANIDQYPCVDIASLAARAALSWAVSCAYWCSPESPERNTPGLTAGNVALSERILLSEIYGKLLQLTRRLHKGSLNHKDDWQSTSELKALIMLTRLLSIISSLASFIDKDTISAHEAACQRSKVLLCQRTRRQQKLATKYGLDENLRDWWSTCVGWRPRNIARIRVRDGGLWLQRQMSPCQRLVPLGIPSIQTPELDQCLERLTSFETPKRYVTVLVPLHGPLNLKAWFYSQPLSKSVEATMLHGEL
jgi:hypothetical protein